MAVYMIFCADEVKDREQLNAYSAAAGPTLGGITFKILAGTEEVQNIEGDWKPARVVMLEFPTREEALKWYESPAYAAVKGMRLAAAPGGAIMIEGFSQPGS
jgi:uncharacterized protein (DUF1330 family)